MDPDEIIRAAILATANAAWEIASKSEAAPEICRAIEVLSDDPIAFAKLVETVKTEYLAGHARVIP